MPVSNTHLRQLISIVRYPRLWLYAKRMGRNNRLGSGGRIINPEEIFLGDNIYIAPHFHISARKLEIGNNVLIGPNLLLECDNHIYKNIGKTIWSTRNERESGFVRIEDDVWIGGNVTILKNVKIGEGTIVGAASVVTKSLPPYSICIGSPCRPIKSRFNTEELSQHLALVRSSYSFDAIKDLWKNSGLL
jgi:acetyltransferase-like isoleucine patch superfamily enzyme